MESRAWVHKGSAELDSYPGPGTTLMTSLQEKPTLDRNVLVFNLFSRLQGSALCPVQQSAFVWHQEVDQSPSVLLTVIVAASYVQQSMTTCTARCGRTSYRNMQRKSHLSKLSGSFLRKQAIEFDLKECWQVEEGEKHCSFSPKKGWMSVVYWMQKHCRAWWWQNVLSAHHQSRWPAFPETIPSLCLGNILPE